MENVEQENEKTISGAIKIDEKGIRDHLDGVVRQSVEDTLIELLNAEADEICHASLFPCSPNQEDTRAGCVRRINHETCFSKIISENFWADGIAENYDSSNHFWDAVFHVANHV